MDIEIPACTANIDRYPPETLWAKKGGQPISIAAECTGIGSGIEGVAKICNSHSVAFISEIDDVTRGVCTIFAHPEDIRGNVLARNVKGDVHSDVYIAGFPCQPFSAAGKQEGFNDQKGRGRICHRLIAHIERALPKVFILENVKGFKSVNNGAAYDEFVDRLKRIRNYETGESAYSVTPYAFERLELR